jgi:ATP-dependent Clp protease ATP-binding subunit ClpC
MLLQVLDDGYLTDSLGRKLILNHNYHDFKCWSKTIKDFGQGVGFETARAASVDDNSKSIENAKKKPLP